ncbi:MAG: protein jag [Clostridia bacterium]|nr:protein jag [Clostridia bacterium]
MIIIEKNGKTIDEAVEKALSELGVTREEVEIEVVNEGKRGLLGLGAEEAVVKVKFEQTPLQKAEKYVESVMKNFGIDVALKSSFEDETVKVEIVGDSNEVGKVIGRRGDTLDALQYLTSLVVNKGEEDYIRVTIDTENYRGKREETLIKLAKRMAAIVARSRKSMTLEPMNPNERRIIHSTLQGYRNVTTYSTGKEPNRSVVIATKKKEYGEDYVSKYRYNRKENECEGL